MSGITSWKQRLASLESLTKGNAASAWKTAQLINQLLNDPKFVQQATSGDMNKAKEKLAVYAGRFAVSLQELMHMYEEFPKRSQWVNARLDVLRDDTLIAISKRKEAKSKSKNGRKSSKRRNPVPYEIHQAVVEENQQLKEKVQELTNEIAGLRSENSETMRQLANAEGRITELERLLDKKFGAVTA